MRIQGEVDAPIEGEQVLEPLLRALEARSLVTLDYRAAGWECAAKLQVVPYTLVHDLFAGSAFLVAWNPGKGQVAHLRLNRIAGVRIEGRGLLGPEARELLEQSARFQVGGWSDGTAPFEVVVQVRGRHWVQALKNAPPPLPDYGFELEGETLKLHFRASHFAGVLRWVLQFGADAVVLAPPELRQELAARTAAMAAAYLPRPGLQ